MVGNAAQKDDSECTFQWDENSQLYYHASSGFYHDPQAGWYYSSRDGQYYKFEDGNYVLLESNQAGNPTEIHHAICQEEKSEAQMGGQELTVKPSLGEVVSSTAESLSSCAYICSILSLSRQTPRHGIEAARQAIHLQHQNGVSVLEDTLIDLFLSGNSDQTAETHATGTSIPRVTDRLNGSEQGDDDIEELEEGEWIPDDPDFWRNFREKIPDEGISEEEENWRAQYGQVSQSDEEWMLGLQTVDLWDWALVRGTRKDGKTEVSRLIGRLMKRSEKLHPSLLSGSRTLKTAPVCEVRLNIVRVTSGRVYRLRIPSLQYAASLPAYDASDPTKDWGFPQLSVRNNVEKLPKCDQPSESQSTEVVDVQTDKYLSLSKDHKYRDRAAERRALHGGFGIGPGQKHGLGSNDADPSSPTPHPEEAAAEALSMSFGSGSYARKLLEGMGWKEGRTLGRGMKGLTAPLEATGNKGTAGLGWEDGRRK